MKTVVFDIDGTISDCSHRDQYAKAKQWDEFHSRCIDDDVIYPIADLAATLSIFNKLVFLTGMNEKYRHLRVRWLDSSGVNGIYEDLLMREDDDYSPDHEMKIRALENYFGSKESVLENVWFVVDDRDSVVEALRNYGLTVLQPAPGAF